MSSRRDLHPGAWWIWALGLAVAATLTTNPFLLLLVVAVAGLVVAMRRSDHSWSLSFRLYLGLGVVIVLIRVGFRILLGSGYDGHVLLDLPAIPLPHWVAGIRLLGPLTRESLLAGLYDGLRLAALVICIGAANALANPKRLLKSMPPALYEIGTSVVVAVALLPQLADSLRRVRAARRLRGAEGGRLRRFRGVVIPVLEDALERSIALAAGMDARGYGRSGGLGRGRRWWTGTLMLAGLVGICVGTYALLDQTAPRWLSTPMMAAGLLLAAGGFISAGSRVRRTRYRADHWRLPELAVAASGIAVAIGIHVLGRDPLLLEPDVTGWPSVTVAALCVVLVGLLPAVVAPPPALGNRDSVGTLGSAPVEDVAA
ncbi:CbiQ family ECF transporter T component [Nocardioides terrisoli]|uniref:CbiQ family ECF transporter T component n=1 Tax=Nocardioides terrisoli TaxID=3388267 RepID=UPI00287B8119|nr:CbiQ family ECF transporter T component [Nocardioides marmorisolisilvae]